jgi:hypothetical protein
MMPITLKEIWGIMIWVFIKPASGGVKQFLKICIWCYRARAMDGMKIFIIHYMVLRTNVSGSWIVD